MLALVADPAQEAKVSLQEAPDPEPTGAEALVEVHAISLNRGEVNRLATAEAGWRPGWDLAGVVLRAAADGSGPKEGTRVVGLKGAGAWAEKVAVATGYLAELPEGVDFAAAASLPVAALTALGILRVPGSILGRSVLLTGAAGGVGRFALQLGSRGGARMTALVGREGRRAGLSDLGASEVVLNLEELAGRQFDVVLESAGGQVLEQAIKLLAPGGTLVSFGNSARERTSLLVNDLYTKGRAAIYGFFLFSEFQGKPPAADLGFLAREVAAGRLDCQVALEKDWHDAASALIALRDRQVDGKAILRVR